MLLGAAILGVAALASVAGDQARTRRREELSERLGVLARAFEVLPFDPRHDPRLSEWFTALLTALGLCHRIRSRYADAIIPDEREGWWGVVDGVEVVLMPKGEHTLWIETLDFDPKTVPEGKGRGLEMVVLRRIAQLAEQLGADVQFRASDGEGPGIGHLPTRGMSLQDVVALRNQLMRTGVGVSTTGRRWAAEGRISVHEAEKIAWAASEDINKQRDKERADRARFYRQMGFLPHVFFPDRDPRYDRYFIREHPERKETRLQTSEVYDSERHGTAKELEEASDYEALLDLARSGEARIGETWVIFNKLWYLDEATPDEVRRSDEWENLRHTPEGTVVTARTVHGVFADFDYEVGSWKLHGYDLDEDTLQRGDKSGQLFYYNNSSRLRRMRTIMDGPNPCSPTVLCGEHLASASSVPRRWFDLGITESEDPTTPQETTRGDVVPFPFHPHSSRWTGILGYMPGSQVHVLMAPETFLALNSSPLSAYRFWGSSSSYLPLSTGFQSDLGDIPLPTLDITYDESGVPHVTGHEGRHRAAVAHRLGMKAIPVVVYLRLPAGNKYEEWTGPSINDDLIVRSVTIGEPVWIVSQEFHGDVPPSMLSRPVELEPLTTDGRPLADVLDNELQRNLWRQLKDEHWQRIVTKDFEG